MASIKYMNEVLKLYGWKVKAVPSNTNGLRIEPRLRDWAISRVDNEGWLTINNYVDRKKYSNEEMLTEILRYEIPRLEEYARTSEKIAHHIANRKTQNLI